LVASSSRLSASGVVQVVCQPTLSPARPPAASATHRVMIEPPELDKPRRKFGGWRGELRTRSAPSVSLSWTVIGGRPRGHASFCPRRPRAVFSSRRGPAVLWRAPVAAPLITACCGRAACGRRRAGRTTHGQPAHPPTARHHLTAYTRTRRPPGTLRHRRSCVQSGYIVFT
jgi:hypothetical protein